MDSNTKYTCRTCLKSKYETECVNISLDDDSNSFVLEMLSFTIPELDVFLVNNPVVCGSCIDLLKTSFNFKTICLKNEEYILKHSQNNNNITTRINISQLPLSPRNKTTDYSTCDKNAGSSNVKTDHLNKIEKSETNLSCENCYGCVSKLFAKPSLHKKVCLPPFSCYNCDKSLGNLQDMRKHMLTHVKQRKCKICHKGFRDLYMLKRHLRVHTRANPYKCNLCDKSFRQYYNLKQHLDKHVGSNNVSCKYCSKVFSTKYNAQIHMKSHDKPLETCDLCGEKFPNKPELVKHLHSSTETCRGGDIKEEEINIQVKEEVDIEDRTFENVLIKTETTSEFDIQSDVDIMHL